MQAENALIGVAENNYQLTLTLIVGALLWNYLSRLYEEISMSIAYERWEGTLEYTFMAPVRRYAQLMGSAIYAIGYGLIHTAVVLTVLALGSLPPTDALPSEPEDSMIATTPAQPLAQVGAMYLFRGQKAC